MSGSRLLDGPFCVRAIRLPGLAGTLSWPGQPELNFAHELAGRVRVIACLDQQPILLHSEKWPDYAASKRRTAATQEEDRLRARRRPGRGVGRGAGYASVQRRRFALRYADATQGVPHETRQPFADGSTQFERILPGPDRMYPDTDSPPQRDRCAIASTTIAGRPAGTAVVARGAIPGGWRAAEYRALPDPTRGSAVGRPGLSTGANLKDVCFFFGEQLKGLRRKGVPIDAVDDAKWCDLLQAMNRNAAWADAWEWLTTLLARSPESSVDALIQHCRLAKPPDGWEGEVREMAATAAMDHPDGSREQRHRFLMGLAMGRLRGRVPAQVVASALGAAREVQA